VNVNPAGSGNITSYQFTSNPVTYPQTFTCSSIYALNAVPNKILGYKFDKWGGSVTGTEDTIIVTMSSSKSVTAYFVLDRDGDGFSVNEGDCNDNDSAIHPGAAEICGDGIDQDCSGSDLSCSGLYDLNHDGIVNIVDITQVAALWNTAVGNPDYDALCDLSNDDKIDILDIMMVAAQWGYRS